MSARMTVAEAKEVVRKYRADIDQKGLDLETTLLIDLYALACVRVEREEFKEIITKSEIA